jgi:hypothetical protein
MTARPPLFKELYNEEKNLANLLQGLYDFLLATHNHYKALTLIAASKTPGRKLNPYPISN